MYRFICGFIFFPLVRIYVLKLIPHCFDCCSFIVGLESGSVSSNFVLFFFFFQDQFCYPESLAILYEFQNWHFHFCKQIHWDFDRDCVESVDCFGEYCQFNIKSDLEFLVDRLPPPSPFSTLNKVMLLPLASMLMRNLLYLYMSYFSNPFLLLLVFIFIFQQFDYNQCGSLCLYSTWS